MTEEYAKLHPEIHFSSMHPGWADTPAVRSSMPDFYEKVCGNLKFFLFSSNIESTHTLQTSCLDLCV